MTRRTDQEVAAGRSLAAALAEAGISGATYYRWRRRFKELSPAALARVRHLERENARLRRIVADEALEIEMLRELSRGTY